MSEQVILHRVAEPQTVFAIDTTGHGRLVGTLIGVTDDVGGVRLPSGNIAHKGIVMQVNGRLLCVPESRSVYEKFLKEVERRHIRLVEPGA